MRKIIDRAGQRYGKLLVLERAKDHFTPGGQRKVKWRCQCDCGSLVEVGSSNLAMGKSKSCGCLRNSERVARSKTHGLTGSPEYIAWSGMKARCFRPYAINYANYGGRGITVAAEWLSFEAFFRDMGPKPSPEHSLDRIDSNGNYCAENCRWATTAEQSRNTRQNVWVTYSGQRLTLTDAAALAGLRLNTVQERRRRGWPDDRLFEPAATWTRAVKSATAA